MIQVLQFSLFLVLTTIVIIKQSATQKLQSESGGKNRNYPASCPGSGWVAFEDQKCIKLIKTLSSLEAAKTSCDHEALASDLDPPTLVAIMSASEQNFLSNYIFNISGVTIAVWIGATRLNKDSNRFVWENGSNVTYTNWGVGSPSNQTGRDCVEMQSKLSRALDGEWKDVSCSRGNWIVCQKLPAWTSTDLQKEIMEIKKNPVPIGFIYTQLPGQPEPSALWPTVQWNDISSDYAGQFFRVLGGNSGNFGSPQSESYKTLSHIQATDNEPISYLSTPVTPGTWSNYVYAGFYGTAQTIMESIRFFVSDNEVRPYNNAIRLWKRL